MSEKLEDTLAYERWESYGARVNSTNLIPSIQEARRFVKGDQYATYTGGAQPVINICKEATDSKVAKITETPIHIRFLSARDMSDMQRMEDFYSFVQKEIDDREFNDRVAHRALVDGTAFVVTAYDKDTYGLKGKYRGHIKRMIVPFERMFFETFRKDDIQDEKFVGYTQRLTVREAKAILEKPTKDRLGKIVPDNENELESDSALVTIYTMFERDEKGEVFYTLSTRYIVLTSPRYLNVDKTMRDSLGSVVQTNDAKTADYENASEGKSLLFEAPDEKDERPGFGRYPISVYAPEPLDDSFVGASQVTPLIPNQKVINYTYLLTTQIVQNNASPKYIVKEGALKGQKITSKPGQVLTDYTPVGYTGWGISQIQGGMGTVSNEIINFSANLISMTRKVNGFDNLTADQMQSDVSGYAYQQYTRQMNLPLAVPQRRFWAYLKDNARTDLLFMRFYVRKTVFLVGVSDAENAENESYRSMSQDLVNQGIAPGGIQAGATLPESSPVREEEIDSDLFGSDWDIVIDSEEGVEGGQAAQGQRYEKVMQYAVNMPDLADAFVESHPGLTRDTKQTFKHAFATYKLDKLAQANATIAQLKQVIQEQNDQLKANADQMQMVNSRMQAQQRAFSEQQKTNVQAMNVMMSGNEGEGQVKSNNAKGIQGSSFDSQ